MSFQLSTESSLSVRDLSVEYLRPYSDSFIIYLNPEKHLANCGERLWYFLSVTWYFLDLDPDPFLLTTFQVVSYSFSFL